MTGPAPAVARVRSAVRASLRDLPKDSLVLAAVSGGRDSMALADALAFVAAKDQLRAGALIIDHSLQQDSTAVAEQVQQTLQGFGLTPVEVVTVSVDSTGSPEAAARAARYQALDAAAERLDAAAVLLGHTIDDQAETVLLGLARGSGARSLSGMRAQRGIYRRPLLAVDRETTGAACAAAGIKPWDDPHNEDLRFQRVKVRHEVMPVLESQLGPGVGAALARTAELLRDDDDALESWAASANERAQVAHDTSLRSWDCEVMAELPAAVRRRIIRASVLAAGATAGSLRHSQLAAIDALIVDWHGQGPVDLPGGVVAERHCGRLSLVLGQARHSVGASEEDSRQARSDVEE